MQQGSLEQHELSIGRQLRNGTIARVRVVQRFPNTGLSHPRQEDVLRGIRTRVRLAVSDHLVLARECLDGETGHVGAFHGFHGNVRRRRRSPSSFAVVVCRRLPLSFAAVIDRPPSPSFAVVDRGVLRGARRCGCPRR